MKTVDESLKYADDFCSSESYLVCLATEVRRLREENEWLRAWIRVEGDFNDTCTRQILGEVCPSCRCGKAVKDAARSAKITQEPAK